MTRKPPWYHFPSTEGKAPSLWMKEEGVLLNWGQLQGSLSGRTPGQHILLLLLQVPQARGSALWVSSHSCDVLSCGETTLHFVLSLVWCLLSCSLLSEKHLLKALTWAILGKLWILTWLASANEEKITGSKGEGGASQKGNVNCKVKTKAISCSD